MHDARDICEQCGKPVDEHDLHYCQSCGALLHKHCDCDCEESEDE